MFAYTFDMCIKLSLIIKHKTIRLTKKRNKYYYTKTPEKTPKNQPVEWYP